MSDEQLMNSDTARTPSGEIKDQSPPPTETEVKAATEDQKSTKTSSQEPSETQSTEEKKDGKSLLNQEEKDGKPVTKNAPEKYEFKLPEGLEMDEATTKEVDDLFRGLDLPQEAAQKLIDFHQAKAQAIQNSVADFWIETQKKWQDEIKADAQLGSRLPEVKATIARAIDGIGDPKLASDFREAMDYTGAGNNPAFIRAFYKLAQQVTEGRHVSGKNPSPLGQDTKSSGGKPATAGHALYPNLP